MDHRESHQCLLLTLKFKLPTHLTKPSWKAKATLLIINIQSLSYTSCEVGSTALPLQPELRKLLSRNFLNFTRKLRKNVML